jgi:hypothetical protein
MRTGAQQRSGNAGSLASWLTRSATSNDVRAVVYQARGCVLLTTSAADLSSNWGGQRDDHHNRVP